MRLRQTAFRDPAAYFHRYTQLAPNDARAKALEIWRTVNETNLYRTKFAATAQVSKWQEQPARLQI